MRYLTPFASLLLLLPSFGPAIALAGPDPDPNGNAAQIPCQGVCPLLPFLPIYIRSIWRLINDREDSGVMIMCLGRVVARRWFVRGYAPPLFTGIADDLGVCESLRSASVYMPKRRVS